MDILVTGGTGQVGRELRALEWPAGVQIHAPQRAEMDLSDAASIDRFVGAQRWNAIINAGAYTAVDKAESEPHAAWAINAMAPAQLAAAASASQTPFIHISTDYVFNGEKQGFYVEDDPIAPLGVYGASKAAGEIAVRAAHPRALIVRTAWVFSAHGSNFAKTMLRLAAERPALRVVADQRGTPTSARDLARTLSTMTLKEIGAPGPGGVFHFANSGEATWWEFASAILDRAAERGGKRPPIEAIDTLHYPTPAKRPANSRLSTRRIEQVYGIRPRPWRDATAEVVDALVNKARGGSAT